MANVAVSGGACRACHLYLDRLPFGFNVWLWKKIPDTASINMCLKIMGLEVQYIIYKMKKTAS